MISDYHWFKKNSDMGVNFSITWFTNHWTDKQTNSMLSCLIGLHLMQLSDCHGPLVTPFSQTHVVHLHPGHNILSRLFPPEWGKRTQVNHLTLSLSACHHPNWDDISPSNCLDHKKILLSQGHCERGMTDIWREALRNEVIWEFLRDNWVSFNSRQ